MAKNGPYDIHDFDNICLLRPLRLDPNVGVCVVRERTSDELFILKAVRKTDDEEDFYDHQAEYDFMKACCTDANQRSLVHLFGCFQNEASAQTLSMCVRSIFYI